MTKIAHSSGRLLKGGDPDINSIAKLVLNDFQRGKLPYYVMPPKTTANETADESETVDESMLESNTEAADADNEPEVEEEQTKSEE